MSRDPGLTSINCTSCGAGLDVRGGGRVAAQVCPYCGAVLDAQRDYQVLAKFMAADRPYSPFAIGQEGEIDGVAFTIIGMLGVRENHGWQTWIWVDHQVYSPSHGYAWLTLEDGHLIFTRKLRRAPRPAFMTTGMVERADNRPTASLGDETFKYYESGRHEIYFAEGEFNWPPRAGRKSSVVSLAHGDRMLSYVEEGDEREVELSRYLPRDETFAAFGVADPPPTDGLHILQPFKALRDAGFRAVVAGLACLFCAAAAIYAGMGERRVAPETSVQFNAMPRDIPFTVTAADQLVRVKFWSNVDNSWASFDLEMSGPEGEVLFAASRGVEYYSGYDDGAWSEGSRSASLTFRAAAPGEHVLSLEAPESEVDWRGGATASYVVVSARENVRSGFWLWIAAGLLLVTALVPAFRMIYHHVFRWAGSDWSDDD